MSHLIAFFLSLMIATTPLCASMISDPVIDFSWQKDHPFTFVTQVSDQSTKNLSPSSKKDHISSPKQGNHDLAHYTISNYTSIKEAIITKASEYLGLGYRFGASRNSSKTDCSLFTQRVFQKLGINLPRSSSEQAQLGQRVARNDLQAGDLLFFRTYKRGVGHVGIYIGNGKMIHASYNERKVIIEDLDKAYFKKRFLFAKRLPLKNTNLNN
ncbi:MAG: C40 family peptidase [Campylobacterales bacterium]